MYSNMNLTTRDLTTREHDLPFQISDLERSVLVFRGEISRGGARE